VCEVCLSDLFAHHVHFLHPVLRRSVDGSFLRSNSCVCRAPSRSVEGRA
jgi:hypothetical protein